MNRLLFVNSFRRLSTNSPKVSTKKNGFSAFFQGLNEKFGIGKQFELEQEKQLWGVDISGINNTSKSGNLITHWKTFNDSEYGGLSKSSFTISEKSQIVTFNSFLQYNDNSKTKQEFTGGYCAITGYCRNTVDLMDFAGIEILIKTSKPCSFLFR